MIYDFICKNCSHEQEEVFFASEYDKKVAHDGRLKRKKCKECQSILLYRHIIKAPAAMGGTKGYISMERWQQQNPDHSKRKEESLRIKMEDRHRRRVLDNINKQTSGDKQDQRHKGYGEGQKERKLKSDD